MIDEKYSIYEEQEEEPINLYAIIFKYLAYWPWFVASVITCMVLCFVYLRYQTPVYNVTASVLIKEQDQRTRSMAGANEIGRASCRERV